MPGRPQGIVMVIADGMDGGRRNEVKVFIADADFRVCKGLHALLDATPGVLVVGQSALIDDVIERVGALRPAVILLDLGSQRLERLSMLTQLATMGELVIAMSAQGGAREVALRAGARAFVEKGARPEVVLEAVHSVAARSRYGASRLQS